MKKTCVRCGGKKKVRGLGWINEPCPVCDAKGYIMDKSKGLSDDDKETIKAKARAEIKAEIEAAETEIKKPARNSRAKVKPASEEG